MLKSLAPYLTMLLTLSCLQASPCWSISSAGTSIYTTIYHKCCLAVSIGSQIRYFLTEMQILSADKQGERSLYDIWFLKHIHWFNKILQHNHMLINIHILHKKCKPQLSIVPFISVDVTHTPEIRWVLKFI